MCGDRTVDKLWKPSLAARHILLQLHAADMIATAFSLHRQDVLSAGLLDSYVKLVYFDLSDVRDLRSKMILERVSRHTGEDVD